jgi:flagellar biosynthesis/type III secretory pathway protein FliH
MSKSFQDEASIKEDEPAVTKLIQSSSLGAPQIETWNLSSFEDDAQENKIEISDEVYRQMEQELQPRLNQQAELLKQEAYDAAYKIGYEEGLLKGHEAGCKQGESEAKIQVMQTLEPKLAQFESILSSLQKPYALLEQKLYSELVDFALHIAKNVIRKEVFEHKDWIVNAVNEAVSTLPESSSSVNIYLHPDDLAFIQISKPSFSENWVLKESRKVKLGTCMVKQDYSTVLNSWVSRFDEVADQLLQDVASNSILEEGESKAATQENNIHQSGSKTGE